MSTTEQAAAAIRAARAVLDDLASISSAPRQEVVDLLHQTAELARIVDAQRVRLAGEIEQRSKGPEESSICALMGKRSPKEAVASAFGIRAGQAAELLSTARATSRSVGISGGSVEAPFPLVAAALAEGAISLAQVRTIVSELAPAAPRADLDQLAWAEQKLVEAATDAAAPLVPELLAVRAKAFATYLDPDGVLPNAERQYAQRDLRIWQRQNGMWHFEGDSPAELGSQFKALMDAYTAPRAKVRFVDDDAPRDDAAEADLDNRSLGQKRHDVLMGLVAAHAASGDAPLAGGAPPRIVLNGTIEAFDAYMQNAEHRERTLAIEHTGDLVPIETVDRLLCEAVVQRAVVDERGHVLDLGREQRLFTKPQRMALAVQYEGCATPGCHMPVAWTEVHHVLWWSRGGPTDTENGILLCTHCHHEVHAGRLLVVGEPGDWRVVPQLRPSDPYARAVRSGEPLRAITAGAATASAAAATSLAVRLPDPPPLPAPPPLARPRRRVRGRGASLTERRLLHRLGDRRRRPSWAAADFHARRNLVLRT
ncbi:HNH endonuclease signature motif containing protein [Agrococcus sp. Marseille-Q4369]|uniref:HNH endonuclease signature motif containing protein n=1 Tax=Agrococcus sp. Marseille-Q4369 TaxID=2810513 RepID=UPI001B8D86E2|nr:HNH endonuclease signature motif containing protein [Agrococcus sp. Marseille-Q4369]QUW17890.1 DUF222 domain-containing protein [Agrococcus sp. Marseille-Q4369]